MELLRLIIHVTGFQKVSNEEHTAQMILFDGTCEGSYFNGTILPGGVDTQHYDANGCGTLSARYMIAGEDYLGQKCNIFVENNAVVGEEYTSPKLYTDSPNLRWMEKDNLKGQIVNENEQLIIIISNDK